MHMIPLNINNPFDRAPIYFRTETDSTMSDADELSRAGAPSGTVVAAGYQTSGRGRFRDRRWMSDSGESLLFTLILAPDALSHPFGLMPLLAGLGVALFVQAQSGLDCQIKWPNDVLVNGRKIAGLLCEAKRGRLLIGVGVNCRQAGFPVLGKLTPTSLRQIGVSHCEPLDLLGDVLRSLKSVISLDDALEQIRRMLHLIGRDVTVSTGLPGAEGLLHGVLSGIGNDGQLMVVDRHTGGLVEVFSGELETD